MFDIAKTTARTFLWESPLATRWSFGKAGGQILGQQICRATEDCASTRHLGGVSRRHAQGNAKDLERTLQPISKTNINDASTQSNRRQLATQSHSIVDDRDSLAEEKAATNNKDGK